MNCDQVREQLMELTPGQPLEGHPAAAHVAQCGDCAKVWTALQKTMSLMDEWQAPEVSPFFDTRFQARLAEVKREQNDQPRFVAWMRSNLFGVPAWRPVLAGALALAAIVSVGVMKNGGNGSKTPTTVAVQGPVSAVHDLQTLDKDEELYSDLDMLDTPDTQDNQQNGAEL
jgi:hypothetical protein